MSQSLRPEDLQPGRTALVSMFPLHLEQGLTLTPAPPRRDQEERTGGEPPRMLRVGRAESAAG